MTPETPNAELETPAQHVPDPDTRSEDSRCNARFGYGYHHCHLPRGHAGDCRCHCGETLEPEPF